MTNPRGDIGLNVTKTEYGWHMHNTGQSARTSHAHMNISCYIKNLKLLWQILDVLATEILEKKEYGYQLNNNTSDIGLIIDIHGYATYMCTECDTCMKTVGSAKSCKCIYWYFLIKIVFKKDLYTKLHRMKYNITCSAFSALTNLLLSLLSVSKSSNASL